MTNIQDVSRIAGTSVGTVSHVLNSTRFVSPELRERVLKAAEELGYEPNQVARGLRSKHTRIIGLMVSDILNPYYTELVSVIQGCAVEAGYQVMVCNSYENPQAEAGHLVALRNYQITGLIIAPTRGNHGSLLEYSQEGLPIVIVNRRLPGNDMSTVCAANRDGAHEATEHLIDRGHTRIGLFLTLSNVSHNEDRVDGYRAAMVEAGLPVDPPLVWYGGSSASSCLGAARDLLHTEPRITALVCGSASTTLGALQAARELEIRIPQELAIVGSGNMPWANLLNPPLTHLSQPTEAMGITAFKLLFGLIRARTQGAAMPDSSPAYVELPVTMIHGGSCGCSVAR